MKKLFVPAGERFSMNYGVFYPENYKDLPLLIYLHGAGERGLEYDHLYRHGVPRLINEGREIPAVVLCPQCPADRVWDNVVTELKEIIDTVAEQFSIKPDGRPQRLFCRRFHRVLCRRILPLYILLFLLPLRL